MINKKEIEHIANLARLELSKEEKETFGRDLSSVLEYFSLLDELDISKIEPTFHSTEQFLVKEERMRKDETRNWSEEEKMKIKDNFVKKEGNYLKTKTIL